MPPKGFKKNDFTDTPLRCSVCTEPIPHNMRVDAVTCSPECSTKRAAMIRDRKAHKECPICHRPATPEQRERYKRWHQWEARGTTDENANVHLLRENQKLKRTIEEMKAGGFNG